VDSLEDEHDQSRLEEMVELLEVGSENEDLKD